MWSLKSMALEIVPSISSCLYLYCHRPFQTLWELHQGWGAHGEDRTVWHCEPIKSSHLYLFWLPQPLLRNPISFLPYSHSRNQRQFSNHTVIHLSSIFPFLTAKWIPPWQSLWSVYCLVYLPPINTKPIQHPVWPMRWDTWQVVIRWQFFFILSKSNPKICINNILGFGPPFAAFLSFTILGLCLLN